MGLDSTAIDVYDLRSRPAAARDAECRRFFDDVYRPSFPDPAIREELGTWLELLAADPVPPRPRLHVIVAADRRDGRFLGGFVCEYYARSGTALGTYLVVAAGARRRGLARRLLAHGRRVLAADAGRADGEGPVLFAETEAPGRTAHEPTAVAAARLAALAALGFLRCELPYVQPPLGPDKPTVDWLILLVHRAHAKGPAEVPVPTVERFLREFYEALGVADPERDPAFAAMRRWLAGRDAVPLLALESALPPAGIAAEGSGAAAPRARAPRR